MVRNSPLLHSLQQAISRRARDGMTVTSLDNPPPSHTHDFFSNDYLSLSTDQSARDAFLLSVQAAPPSRLLGSTGSRLETGNSPEFNALEKKFQHFFQAPSALLFSSGFIANLAFLATVPQKDDVIIYDELVHASCREGIRLSSGTSYRFSHNSVDSFKECLLDVLRNHPRIMRRASTVFVLVESLYGVDGDFCPLTEMVELIESRVPAGYAHIIVDEAHTSGICGPNGTGYVSHLGLNDRVHTKVHTFGKAWGFHGAVVLTSPVIRKYLINFGKSVMFSTSMPYTDIYALESCLGVMSSARGQELRKKLNNLSHYAHQKISLSLWNVPDSVLALSKSDPMFSPAVAGSDRALCYPPVIPVFAPQAGKLAEYLLKKGYAVSPMTHPAVDRPRIRIIIHAQNTGKEIDGLVNELVAWAARQERVSAPPNREERLSTGERARL